MLSRLLIRGVGLLLVGLFATVPSAWAITPKVERAPQGELLRAPAASGQRSQCNMARTSGEPVYYWDGYSQGTRTVTYFDPSTCGGTTYPFEISALSFPLFDPGAYIWPVSLDVVVYGLVSGQSCNGPGPELYRFSVSCDSVGWSLPNVGTAWFPTPCCVSSPFFIGVEYRSSGAGPFPSVLYDSSAIDTCANWQYSSGAWTEWKDFWMSPAPGYPIFFVEGQTNSPRCGLIVKINELNVMPGQTGAELPPYRNQWVELYNSGSESVNLSGWTISNRSGTILVSLPLINLPARAFLTVRWAGGANDFDFSDLDGSYYTNDSSLVFNGQQDECALYSGSPSAGTIKDFISWSLSTFTPGTAHGYAVSAGIWTSGQFFNPVMLYAGHTPGRVFNGWDTNSPNDWMVYRWKEYIVTGLSQPSNPAELTPQKALVITETMPNFTWNACPSVDFYQLQVDNNSDFSSPEINTVVSATSFIPSSPMVSDLYSYRLRGIKNNVASNWSAVWIFVIDPTGQSPKDPNAGCPFKWQHKDTKLLCTDWLEQATGAWGGRPGCAETGRHAWDVAHPDAAPPGDEPHCDNYCARASIAMLNAKYGGDLSEDRISFHYFFEIADRVGGPEGDMGHGAWMVGNDFVHSLDWALNLADGTVDAKSAAAQPGGAFTFAQMKGWIDQFGCFMVNIPGHVMVANGYTELSMAMGNKLVQILSVNDPARGPNTRMVYTWQNIGAPQPGGENYNFTWVFLQPAGVLVGRMQEATITTDSDNDGIMDFDENLPTGAANRPRLFQSKFNETDSDSDEVNDKNEIRNYTFHDQAGHHSGHENDPLNFPDIDGDGLRAEHDCDSDNDADFDGGEDINGDGLNPIPADGAPCLRETCQFDAGDKCITLHVDKDTYFLGEPVKLVDVHGSRETHTFHGGSSYHYELGPGCIVKADGDAIAWNGTFGTDAGGHAKTKQVMTCLFPGQYYLYADVLSDKRYSTPDNWDPWTCWECIYDWFHGWHWGYDYPYHNSHNPWPVYSYPRVCTYSEPLTTTVTVETPWWWWCYQWPPVTDDYYIGVAVPTELVSLSLVGAPAFTVPFPNCNPTPQIINQFAPDTQVQQSLNLNFSDPNYVWMGFSIKNWQIQDSLMSTMVPIHIQGQMTSSKAQSYIKIRAGDAVYGWSPTFYDSIPIGDFGPPYVCGDADASGIVNISDAVYLIAYVFSGGPAPNPVLAGDVDCSGIVNISDAVYLIAYIFNGSPVPCAGCK